MKVLAWAVLCAASLLPGRLPAQGTGSASPPLVPASQPAAPSGPVAVGVLELGDGAVTLFNVQGDRLFRRLQLTVGRQPVTGSITLSASPVQLLDGTLSVVPSLYAERNQPSRTIAAGDHQVIDLVVNGLAMSGEYVGQLNYTVGEQGASQSKAFRIVRPAPTDMPLDLVSVERTKSPDDVFKVSVRGTADKELDVTPTLLALSRTGVGTSASDPVLGKVTFTPSRLKFSGSGFAQTEMQVAGLGPGEYSGKLGFDGGPYKQKTESFSIAVRSGGWIAFTAIVAGSLVSLVLRRLASRVRPRLVARTAISKLLWYVQSVRDSYELNADEAGVLNAIRNRIAAYYDQAVQPGDLPSSDWSSQTQTALAAEGDKLQAFTDWANARRLLDSVTGLDPVARQGFETRLASVGSGLRDKAALPPGLVQDLGKITGDIQQVRSSVAENALAAATGAVSTAETLVSSNAAREDLTRAKYGVATAASLLAEKDYTGFRRAYEDAGLAYYRGLAHELAADLPSRPSEEDDAQRTVNEHLAQVHAAPDLRSARNQYMQAHLVYAPASVPPSASDVQMAVPRAPDSLSVPDPGVAGEPALVPPLVRPMLEDPKALSSETRALDIGIDVVAVTVSGFLGVLLIWRPVPGWGQAEDVIAAFLWGLGLYTVGTSTFQGIFNVTASLAGRT